MATIFSLFRKTNPIRNVASGELARAMTYAQVQEGEEKIQIENEEGEIVDFDYVTFDAFFLRDLDGDGYAESIRGTCREMGKEDTLYMELNVLTNGYLENGVITINSDNFYLQTSIPKDSEIKNNVIGNNIKKIELNTINNGTQKMLTGIVKTGDMGRNINNYSKVNSVTLTGTHVDTEGNRTEINKTVEFNIDWYGKVSASIGTTYQTGTTDTAITEGSNEVKISFSVNSQETKNQLILKKLVLEGTIPELNGYKPTRVEVEGTGIEYTYNENTMKFTIQKEAVLDEATGEVTSTVSRSSSYNVIVTYPIEAYEELGADTIEVRIPVTAYYEGYNNANSEFKNPETSNRPQATIVKTYNKPTGTVAKFEVKVNRKSKEKPLRIYNEISSKEENDNYLVTWYGSTGSDGQTSGMVMKETKNEEQQVSDQFIKTNGTSDSMENLATNVGIYFSNPRSLLGENGWIKVYDEETDELLETFTSKNWEKYNASEPYTYKMPVRHIRIETSQTNASSSITVYNVKQLDDEYITQNYTRSQFDTLQSIKSTLTGYIGESYVNTDTKSGEYWAPYSSVTLNASKNTLSTQETEKNMQLTISASGNSEFVEWVNGIFLLKIPENIIDLKVNSVEINNVRQNGEQVNNSEIQITSWLQYEEDGIDYIKIYTENENPASYQIVINCDITPDPRMVTKTETIELYAYNENTSDYNTKVADIYDINGNSNKGEMITKASTGISMIAPNSLLTNQSITNYNNEGGVTVAPNLAEVQKGRTTADINIEVKNNYTNTISDIKILGRVPYQGNRYTINGNEMGSNFTATMNNAGIQLPQSLQGIATIYYSEKEDATKDLEDDTNGWTTEPENFNNVRSYLIDFGDHSLERNETHTFTYTVNIPTDVTYNAVTFSHHAIYFSLDTEQGKYRTQTEPNKVGITITKQYDLELIKYQIGKDVLVPKQHIV